MAKRDPLRVKAAREAKALESDFLDSALKTEDVIVLNLPPGARQRTRVTSAGKVQRRITLEVESEPVLHDYNFADRRLGRAPAEIMAEIMGERIKNNPKRVSAATLKTRKSTDRAWHAGRQSRYLKDRYSGGRIGNSPPPTEGEDQGTYGYHSGRMADHLFARHNATDKSWTINVPANRLKIPEFRAGNLERFIGEILQIANLATIVSDPQFLDSLQQSLESLIGTLEAALWRKKLRRNRAIAGVARTIRGTFLVGVI